MQKPLAMGRRSSLTQAQGGTILEAAFLGGTMKRTSRAPSNLSESVHHQLNTYALAATAAGVGMLAFVQPSEAEIVYTPAHLAIKANGGLFSFDLDHNGVSDFGISNKGSVTSASYRMLRVRESRSANEIWMT